MNHKENYSKILSALSTITTKGNDTLTMANCMNFLGQCIKECAQAEAEAKLKAGTEAEEGEAAEEGEES